MLLYDRCDNRYPPERVYSSVFTTQFKNGLKDKLRWFYKYREDDFWDEINFMYDGSSIDFFIDVSKHKICIMSYLFEFGIKGTRPKTYHKFQKRGGDALLYNKELKIKLGWIHDTIRWKK